MYFKSLLQPVVWDGLRALWWSDFLSWWEEEWSTRRDVGGPLQFLSAVCGRWGPADTDDVRQDTYVGLSREVSWSGVWLTIPVSLIPALFMLLSQPFISIFIPHSLILQYNLCDGIGCSDDSLWGKPITEYSSSYWYQKTVEWTSVLRSTLCIVLKTLANIHSHQNNALTNKI